MRICCNGVCVSAVFDDVSSGVTVESGGKKVKSRGSNEHALVNFGFKSVCVCGVAVWFVCVGGVIGVLMCGSVCVCGWGIGCVCMVEEGCD